MNSEELSDVPLLDRTSVPSQKEAEIITCPKSAQNVRELGFEVYVGKPK